MTAWEGKIISETFLRALGRLHEFRGKLEQTVMEVRISSQKWF